MSFETYNVYFAGQIIKDHDPVEVRKKIGAMFKLEGERLERLFSGQPVAIKKDVDMDQAVKYRVAFRDAGALVDIRPAPSPVSEAAPTSATGSQATPPSAVVSQPAGEEPFTLSAANSFDLSDCAPAVIPQEIPDISALDLDKPGIILDESSPPEPLVIDIDELELDQPGSMLDKTAPPAPVEIDTHELTLNPAHEGTLEDCHQPVASAPTPDIDHLQFVEQEEKPEGKARFDISED